MNREIDTHMSQDNILLEMTRKLPKLRKAFNISQTQLGKLVGKSRQQISKIERGITPLSWDTCLAIIMITRQKNLELFNSIIPNNMLDNIDVWIDRDFKNFEN